MVPAERRQASEVAQELELKEALLAVGAPGVGLAEARAEVVPLAGPADRVELAEPVEPEGPAESLVRRSSNGRCTSVTSIKPAR